MQRVCAGPASTGNVVAGPAEHVDVRTGRKGLVRRACSGRVREKIGRERAGGAHLARERPSSPPRPGRTARPGCGHRGGVGRAEEAPGQTSSSRTSRRIPRRGHGRGWSEPLFEGARTTCASGCASALHHLACRLQHLIGWDALEARGLRRHRAGLVEREAPSGLSHSIVVVTAWYGP